jgi:hypothetical protein
MEKCLYIIDRSELLELIEQAVSNAIGSQPNKENGPKFLTADEAWQYLKLPSLGSLYQLTCKKKVTSIRNGKRLTFLQDDLDKFMMSGRRKAAKVEAQ